MSATTPTDVARVHRVTVRGLIVAQVLGSIGFGAGASVGALLVAEVAGGAWSGLAATMSTLGAAAAAVPLARLAVRAGRRISLATGAIASGVGAALTIVAASTRSLPLLLIALGLVGVGAAVNLQSRFAATDLSEPGRRGRDLSVVVWSTTIGAVLGPNLSEPGAALGRGLGLPDLAGAFLLTVVAQALAASVYLVMLRPDSLKLARDLQRAADLALDEPSEEPASWLRQRRFAVLALCLAHATMVAIMAMTPVHLTDAGHGLEIVGLTISIHVAGMFGLSPVFGVLSDRWGRLPTLLLGQVLFAVAIVINAVAGNDHIAVMVALAALGLGWSASTVSASALVAESTSPASRASVQGRSDLLMSASGAVGGALAGPALVLLGYGGMGLAAAALVAVVLCGAVVLRN